MSNKSFLYLVTAVVLMCLFDKISIVCVEFIKSTNEPQQSMPFFMMPPEGFQQQRMDTGKPPVYASKLLHE